MPGLAVAWPGCMQAGRASPHTNTRSGDKVLDMVCLVYLRVSKLNLCYIS